MALVSLYIPHICRENVFSKMPINYHKCNTYAINRTSIFRFCHNNNLAVDIKNTVYLSKLQFTVGSSILLIRTIRCLTPAVLASIACSRVWPPFSKPVSNSPFLAEITWQDRREKKNPILNETENGKKNKKKKTRLKKEKHRRRDNLYRDYQADR